MGKSGIYKITNKINGKLYIGSSKDLDKRREQHKRAYRDTIIHTAIRKYGVENFQFEVLEYCKEQNLIEREQFYYDKLKPQYNAIRPIENPMDNDNVREKHYQIMNRPEMKEVFRIKTTEIWKSKTDEERNYIIDATHSEEANQKRIKTMNTDGFRERQSAMMKDVWGDKEYYEKNAPIRAAILKEIQQRPEVKKKQSYNGKKRWENQQYRDYIISQTIDLMKKKVYLNDGMEIYEFESISQCSRWIAKEKGIDKTVARTTISGYLNGTCKSVFGYNVSFEKDVKPFKKQKRVMKNRTKVHDKPVVMLDKDLNFIKKFDTVKDGGDYIGVRGENISRVCKGKNKTSGGYKWMYYEDYQALTK